MTNVAQGVAARNLAQARAAMAELAGQPIGSDVAKRIALADAGYRRAVASGNALVDRQFRGTGFAKRAVADATAKTMSERKKRKARKGK